MSEEDLAIDLKFPDFVERVFQLEPNPPFSFRLQFLEEIDMQLLRKMLAYFIMTGAKMLYKKELAELSENQIDKLKEYLLSIGYLVEYKVDTSDTKKTDWNKEGIKVNHFIIDFKPASQSLNPHYTPGTLA